MLPTNLCAASPKTPPRGPSVTPMVSRNMIEG
jgi:hypothetical protein